LQYFFALVQIGGALFPCVRKNSESRLRRLKTSAHGILSFP